MKKLAILVFVSILLSTAAAAGQHIHVLMVADTADSQIGKACFATIQNVTNSLSYLIPSDRYSLAIVESSGKQDSGIRSGGN